MKTLVAVMAHSGGNEILARNWPWLERCECDMLGVGRTNTEVAWPKSSRLVETIKVGVEQGAAGENHLRRLLSVLNWFLDADHWERVVVVEYDCIFLRPVPATGGDYAAYIAGHRNPPFRGEVFYHAPWCFSFIGACDIITFGRRMIKADLLEGGFIDRFLGLMVDLYDLQIHSLNGCCYSANTIEGEHIANARKAIEDGAWHVHGVKSLSVLQQLTAGL